MNEKPLSCVLGLDEKLFSNKFTRHFPGDDTVYGAIIIVCLSHRSLICACVCVRVCVRACMYVCACINYMHVLASLRRHLLAYHYTVTASDDKLSIFVLKQVECLSYAY